ncbi:Epsin-3 [Saguinus oedipus]|uniref:Epsin-3 n=1 Tax=Saguinus oedipus TaxID=9490 RepID=A0ABQ9VEZ2_SAGOE|nr:Epsin-3 [Saguinus oedipus]
MALEGIGIGSGQLGFSGCYSEDYGRSRSSPSSSSSSPRCTSDLEQARPQTSGEEELQLQLALAMSREVAEKGELLSAISRTELEREERKEKEKLKSSQSPVLDLADIFVPAPAPPSTYCSADPWDIPGLRPNKRDQCLENLYTIQTLKDFQYIDRDGKDQGVNVREKVKQVMALLKDEERLWQERTHALKTKERMALEGIGIGSGQLGFSRCYSEDYGRSRSSPSSYNSSSSSPRCTSDLEQARPQTSGEEELQLQLALAMSHEEAEKGVLGRTQETSGSSWGPSADPWSPISSGAILSRSQPWDLTPKLSSSEPCCRTPVLPAEPPTTDPRALNSPHHKLPSTGADPWGASMETSDTPALGDASAFDPFAKPTESTETKEGLEQALPSGKPSSPAELDPSPKEARACWTPESFLGPSASSLVNLDSLVKAPQAVKTRNPFLTGLSAPSPINPFGTREPGRPMLNQMRTGSPALGLAGGPMGAPLGSKTYSASLPLPLSSVPAGVTLPASVSVFPQAGDFAPPQAGLGEQLLPTPSSAGPRPPSPQSSTNPFL